ncbi:MAG: DUF1611 domain-containing protein [Candidatus Krumholzibacteria bacterium]|nr:DUF1611 domain-containing protein [Candidatus Krumholzibacteria bacterium]
MERLSSGESPLSYPLPIPLGARRMAILADGCFSALGAKTAVCLVRYAAGEVVAVIDASRAPSTAGETIGFGGSIPVVASLKEALAFGPNTLVFGTAPRGGMIARADRAVAVEAIRNGLHVMNGMHEFLGDDEDLAALAAEKGVVLWDARRPPKGLGVASGKGCAPCPVVFTVGSDCNTGKMTAGMEIHRALLRDGVRSGFAASGQTGIMIMGTGIPVDRVIADFIGGATERLVRETAPGNDVVILEGQGSILHPGYAGVVFGMIAGVLPRAYVLCHQPTRETVRGYTVPIPPLAELASLYEGAISGIRRIPVIGIALNTFDLDDEGARRAVEAAERETGRPVTDPVRFGAGVLARAIRGFLSI